MELVIFAKDGANITLKHNIETSKLFDQTRQLDREIRVLCRRFTQDIRLDLPDFYEFEELVHQSQKCCETSCKFQISLLRLTATSANKNFERSPYKVLQSRKAVLIRQNLKRRHFQLIFIIQNMIKYMLGSSLHTEVVIDGALMLCALLNETIDCIVKKNIHKSGGAQICSNTFPALMSQPKKIDVGVILQAVSKQRSEQCCLHLITCLLAASQAELAQPNPESDTSSVEILKALTSHLQSPKNGIAGNRGQARTKTDSTDTVVRIEPADNEDPTINFFDNLISQFSQPNLVFNYNDIDGLELLERLIHEEENFMANIMLKCLKLCPSVFDNQVTKEELIKWINRGTRSLWTQVGETLDHVVLWWSNAPISCQPPSHARYLRDWLLAVQPDDAPEPILSTLQGLGETLTTHVTTTTWDKQFQAAIVSASLPIDIEKDQCPFEISTGKTENQMGTINGELWIMVLKTLVKIANSCDQAGTIPNELPIVEQIPILHRLDHSIHSFRLWAAEKSKSLCSEWNMKMFFKIVHRDIGTCLEHLNDLRVPQLVPPDPLEVHIQVCVALRAKLVSEIKINIQKLKLQAAQCIDVLASICMTTSLATLSLCFPAPKTWQTEFLQDKSNDYVKYILDQVFLPVVEATPEWDILSLILKIICEAWLDHIYCKRVKFSRVGALNLLKDFDGVADWIVNCHAVPVLIVDRLSKHEVLRMCEGVGRILLRKPEELIPMLPESHVQNPYSKKDEPKEEMEDGAPLPPEMFVPNQKRWLELRAKDRKSLGYFLCICGGSLTGIISH